MSFSFERLFTIELFCYKCSEPLTPYISPNIESIYIGAAVYECKNCGYKIIIKEKD